MRRPSALAAILALTAAACTGAAGPTNPTTSAAAPTSTLPAAPTTTQPAPTMPGPAPVTRPPDTTTTAAPTFVSPPSGGTLVIAAIVEPPTLNPLTGEFDVVRALATLWSAGAHRIDPSTLRPVADAVVALPSVANGGVTVTPAGDTRVTWTLVDEAVWADGEPISGADLAFTLDTLATLQPAAERGWEVVDAEAGPKNFTATFAGPTVAHELVFATILPSHAVAGTDVATDWDDRTWPAGGPFTLTDWVRGESVTFTRNPRYWRTDPAGQPLPYLDEIVVRFVPEHEAIPGLLAEGEVDLAWSDTFGTIPLLEQRPLLDAAGVSVELVGGPVWQLAGFSFSPDNANPRSLNPLIDYRLAVAEALDRDALAAGYRGLGQPALDGFLGVSVQPWAPVGPAPEQAELRLARLCQELRLPCDAEPPAAIVNSWSVNRDSADLARALAAQLDQIGIAAETETWEDIIADCFTPCVGFDLPMFALPTPVGAAGIVEFFTGFFDPDQDPYADGGANFLDWGTPGSLVDGAAGPAAMRELLAALRAAVDAEAVYQLGALAEELLASEMVIVPIVRRPLVAAHRPDAVAGFVMHPAPGWATWNVEEWHRPG